MLIGTVNCKCRNKNCNNWFNGFPFGPVQDMLYCSEDCWIEDWCNNGTGVRHPSFPNVEPKMKLKNKGQKMWWL